MINYEESGVEWGRMSVRPWTQDACNQAKAAIRAAGGNWDGLSCDQIAANLQSSCCIFNTMNAGDTAVRQGMAPNTCQFATPDTNPGSYARYILRNTASGRCGATDDQLKPIICADSTLFADQPKVRTWAGCGAPNPPPCSSDCATCKASEGGCCASANCGGTTTPNLVIPMLVGLAAVVGIALALNRGGGTQVARIAGG